MGKLYYS